MKKHFNKFLSFFLVLAMMVSVVSPAAVEVSAEPVVENPGIYATMDINWNEETQTDELQADSSYLKEFWMRNTGAWIQFALFDENGSMTDIDPASLVIRDGEGTAVTEGISYRIAGSDDEGNYDEETTRYVMFLQIRQTGDFKVYYGEEAEDYVTLHVEYPRLGFFEDETRESAYVYDYTYTNLEKNFFYLIMEAAGDGETYLQEGSPYLTVWDHDLQAEITEAEAVAEYATLSEVQGSQNVYKVTITAEGARFELRANIDGQNTDGEGNPNGNPWTDTSRLDINYEELVTGLAVTTDFDWSNDVPTKVEYPEYHKTVYGEISYMTVSLKYIERDGEGNVTSETALSLEDIELFNSDGEPTQDAVIEENVNANDPEIMDIKFFCAGDYKIGYQYAEGKWDYVTLSMGQPRVGFYTAADYENGSYIFETLPYYDREEKPQFYVIVKKAEEGMTQNIPENFLQVQEPDTEEWITAPEQLSDFISYEEIEVPAEETEIQAVYMVTVVTDRGFQLQANVECVPGDPKQEVWTASPRIGIWYEERPDGLKVADHIEYNEDGPYIHDDSGYFNEIAVALMEERTFAFVVRDEEGANTELNGTMSVQFNEEEEILLEDEPVDNEYIAIEKIRTSGEEWYYNLRLEKRGAYTFTYKEDGQENKSVTLYAELPLFGIYTSATIFDDTTIYLEPELDYLNQDYYVVVSKKYGEWVEGFEPDVLNYEKDVVEFVQESSGEEYDVYHLQVRDDVTAGFDMILPVTVRWGEGDEDYYVDERWYRFKGDESGRIAYTDGEEHLGYTGCYLYDYEYEAGGVNWGSGEPIYYAHADSIQGVIDKLSALANGEEVLYAVTSNFGHDIPDKSQSTEGMNIVNTGYMIINVSHLGDVELQDQYVSSSGNMKGIIFESGHDWRYTKHADNEDGFYVEDIVYKVQPALETIKNDTTPYEEDYGEVTVPDRFEDMNYISGYMGKFYEVDDTGEAFVMGDMIEWAEDEKAFAQAFLEVVTSNHEYYRAAMPEAFEFPNLHVNIYCDMKFGGCYEKLSVGFKEGKEYSATIVNGVTGEKTVLSMEDLEGQPTKVENVSISYHDKFEEEKSDDIDVLLYNIDSETTTSGDFSGEVSLTETPEPNSMHQLTDDQKAAIEESKKLTVNVHTDGKKESDLDKEVVDGVKGAVKGEKDGAGYKGYEYVDIGVTAKVEGVEGETQITDTKAPMEITMEIPKGIQKKNRKFKMVRHHKEKGGKTRTEVIDCKVSKDGKHITFKTDCFSTYAICYDSGEKANFDMSKVKWNYTDAYTYDGKAKKVELTGLPAGLNVTYTGNTATEVGTYTAKATFSYDDFAYNAPDVSKIATLTWQIKEPSKVGQTVASTSAKYEVTADEDGNKTVEYTGLTKKSTKKVKIPSSVKIGNETYKVTSIADDAFKNNNKMTSVTIPSTVETIGKNAFKGCKKLTKVTIPKNVTTIGKDAFRNCKKLKTITIKSKNITSVGKGAFKGVSSKITIKVPKSKKKAYTKLFKKAGYKNKIK